MEMFTGKIDGMIILDAMQIVEKREAHPWKRFLIRIGLLKSKLPQRKMIFTLDDISALAGMPNL